MDNNLLSSIRDIMREELAKASTPVSTMSMSEVCVFLHLTRPAIYRRIKDGLLTPRHVGKRLLFDRSQVEGMIK